MNPSILTHSGNYFDFTNPEASVINIEDIAHALSHVCRFAGHCSRFYSVAQHCVLASLNVQKEHRYDTLMHDAAEAFIGDIPTPLKMLLPDYRAIEERIERAIALRFMVSYPLPPEVKHIDLVMLATERRDLLTQSPDEWGCLDGISPLEEWIVPWDACKAKQLFLYQYRITRGNDNG